jgi:hypothetical protein
MTLCIRLKVIEYFTEQEKHFSYNPLTLLATPLYWYNISIKNIDIDFVSRDGGKIYETIENLSP